MDADVQSLLSSSLVLLPQWSTVCHLPLSFKRLAQSLGANNTCSPTFLPAGHWRDDLARASLLTMSVRQILTMTSLGYGVVEE